MPSAEVKLFYELPEWLAEAVRPPDDPRTFDQALAQLIGKNAELRAEVKQLREALRWCGDHGDNGCWQKANEVLGDA